jgi:hypothetical protein
MRNRIINGAMQINQRGSTVTTLNDATNFFPVDRFTGASLSDGSITGEQSTDAPTGFTNSIKYTVTSADSSLSASQYARLYYQIEGLNVSDLAWGSASAATVTLSFWAKSSVTGTFGGTIQNSARDRSYAFSYTIISANTWEQKSITIAGDQSGTWLKDNGVGLRICYGLAAGSSYQQSTTNTWQATGVQFAPSTALNLLATNGATFYITGVQLEAGTTASPFEYRQYGTELALCQRYYEKSYNTDVAVPTATEVGTFSHFGASDGSNNAVVHGSFAATKRATPTMTYYNYSTNATSQAIYGRSGASGTTTTTDYRLGATGFGFYASVGAAWVTCSVAFNWSASAEL